MKSYADASLSSSHTVQRLDEPTTKPSKDGIASPSTFTSSRLFSKRRQLQALKKGRRGDGKAKAEKPTSGMSLESKMLLGLMTEDEASKKRRKDKAKKSLDKRALLLNAEGRRHSRESVVVSSSILA